MRPFDYAQGDGLRLKSKCHFDRSGEISIRLRLCEEQGIEAIQNNALGSRRISPQGGSQEWQVAL